MEEVLGVLLTWAQSCHRPNPPRPMGLAKPSLGEAPRDGKLSSGLCRSYQSQLPPPGCVQLGTAPLHKLPTDIS